MIPAIKTELRKLFTIRSTYVIMALAFALVAFYAFYISGWRADTSSLHVPNKLALDVTGAVGTVAIFMALIALLLFTHEYRYNTIMYTLTANRSRSRILLAKIIVISVVSLLFTLAIGVFSPLMSAWGVHAHHLHLVPQTFHYGDLFWQCLFYGWGYAMAGLLIAALVRNQIGAIVSLFILPGTVESLLGLLLKKNVVYLPFNSLFAIINRMDTPGSISPERAALVFSAYLVGGWLIAWLLFFRRDT